MKIRFTLTLDHVKLLQHMWVTWDDAEYGAPAIDPKRPYGNSFVAEDIHEILGWPIPTDDGERERYFDGPGAERARAIHKEMETALQIVLRTGSFEPAVYEANQYQADWHRAAT